MRCQFNTYITRVLLKRGRLQHLNHTDANYYVASRLCSVIPYEGCIIPTSLWAEFDNDFHCPTAVNASNFAYYCPSKRNWVAATFLGDPRAIGPNINHADAKTNLNGREVLRAVFTQPPSDDKLLSQLVADAKGHKVILDSKMISVTLNRAGHTKIGQHTEVVIDYGSDFFIKPTSARVYCDVCFSRSSTDANDPLILCDGGRKCSTARHRMCFITPPTLLAIGGMKHSCSLHSAVANSPHLRTNRGKQSADPIVPTHCNPTSSFEDRAIADGNDGQMISPSVADGIRFNCDRLALDVRDSTISTAGKGLFTTIDRLPKKQRKKGKIIGYFFGEIIAKDAYRALLDDNSLASTEAQKDFCEDWRRGVDRALDITDTISCSNSGYILLVSKQCPMGYMNDASHSGDALVSPTICTFARPTEYELHHGVMDYRTFAVRLPLGRVKAASELFLDYGMSEGEWAGVAQRSKNPIQLPLQQAAASSPPPPPPCVGKSSPTVTPMLAPMVRQMYICIE